MTKPTSPKLVTFPIYVLIEEESKLLPGVECKFARESELPETGSYFVVAKDGVYLHKDTAIVRANVKCDVVRQLGELNEPPRLHLPRIPSLIIARSHEFFQKVWRKHRGEAEVMLLFNNEYKQYDIWCPTQEVSGGGVWYDLGPELEAATNPHFDSSGARTGKMAGWTWVGTIHSHCDFGAYHSWIDEDDEGKGHSDGIHVTIGHVNGDEFSMCSSIVIQGERWQVPPENVIRGIKRAETGHKSVFVSRDEFFKVQLNDKDTKQFYDEYEPQTKQWLNDRVSKGWGQKKVCYTVDKNQGFID